VEQRRDEQEGTYTKEEEKCIQTVLRTGEAIVDGANGQLFGLSSGLAKGGQVVLCIVSHGVCLLVSL